LLSIGFLHRMNFSSPEPTQLPKLELVLPDEQRQACQRFRFQERTIRSVHAGTFTIRYETGSTEAGRVCPAELSCIAPLRE